MVKVKMTGVYPVPLDKMWKMISLHNEHTLEIHPRMKSVRRTVPRENTLIEEREYETDGGRVRSVWKYVLRPPDGRKFSTEGEILEGRYVFFKGSRWTNTYAGVPEGTRVTTVGEFVVPGVADEEARRMVERWGEQTDREDFAFFDRHPELL